MVVTVTMQQAQEALILKNSLILISGILLSTTLYTMSAAAVLPSLNQQLEQAITLRHSGEPARSVELLNTLLARHPKNLRLKVELAASLLADSQYAAARTLTLEVLASASLPPVVRENINLMLASIEHQSQHNQARQHQTLQSLSIFTGYDSNANIAPADGQIDIGELNDSSLERGEYFKGMLYDLSHLQATKAPLNQSLSPAAIYQYSGFSAYKKDYSGFNSSDLLYLNARAGIKYIQPQKWYAKLRGDVTYVNLDNRSLVNFYQLSSKAGIYYRGLDIAVQLSAKRKDFHTTSDRHKNGFDYMQRLSAEYPLGNKSKISMSAAYINSDLNNKSYARHSHQFSLSLTHQLTGDIRFNLSSHRTKDNYQAPQKHYSDHRRDSTYRHQLGININDFYRDLDALFTYSYIDRQSNHDINVYDRHLAMLTLKYSFGS